MEFTDVNEFGLYKVRIEWRIENFSSWDSNYHEPCFESPSFASVPDFKVLLYPTVTDADDEMRVSCCFGSLRLHPGDLTFYANDIQVGRQEFEGADVVEENLFHIMAPNLSRILKKIVGGENFISLRFRFEAPAQQLLSVCMCTTLEIISEIKFPFTLSELFEPNTLLAITCPGENGEEEQELFHLHQELVGNASSGAFDLQLRSVQNWSFHKMLVASKLRIFSAGNIERMAVECRHAFEKVGGIGGEPWTIANLTLEDFSYSIEMMILELKFISGKITSCEHSLLGNPDRRSGQSPSPEPENTLPSKDEKGPCSSGEELLRMCQDRDFTDCELRCGDCTFPTHRAILSARSPFFKQMFLSNRKEKCNSVRISNMEPPTLDRFLYFLYTGSMKDLDVGSAIELYHAADKYQVPTLKAECVEFLRNNISVSKACSVLSLADEYKIEELTTSAQNFVMDNFRDVAESDEWLSFMKTNPRLLVNTMTELAANGYF